ncbi:hypothetical protein Tco_1040921 [Tanacetum coccineum]|uniref:Integrase, catalytic region, zinc finger, CCHC-type, peptidase aspartic, catalytic n=1 Tax=Tanacetum coccineum TaxID=301880 RepID=A0ABQ5GFC9_9ASTR
MRNIKMTMSRMQLNSKFINNMLPEWGRFVTAVKLNRGLRDSNYDQLYAYLKQHEAHANENKMLLDRFTQHTVDPLALMSNVSHQQYYSQSSTTPPHFADNTQLDSGISPTDNLIENLTNILSLLTQSYKTYLPQTNNQLRTSSNTRNQATVQDGRVVVQNVQGRQNRGQGNNARGAGAAGYGGAQNRVGNANPGQARQIKCYNYNYIGHIENGVALDEEQLLFIASGQDNAIDEDVDEQLVQDLALNVDNVFQANNCDAFYSDVDEAPTTQTMFMANLSSTDLVYDEASPSYDSDIISEINEQLRIVIADHNRKEENLKRELHSVKLQLTSTINHNKSMVEEVTSLKKDFKQKENKYLEEFLDMKALKEKVEDKLYKQDHQPALYNGHEIIKTNHVPAIVHNSEDTLEIAKITRKKMNDKMKDLECVKKKVKIAPHDYSKENYLATFTPQKQLTLEQIFWSKDLIKMKAEALKEQTIDSRPIKALTMYPPNTPATLVPRVLPTLKKPIKRELHQRGSLKGKGALTKEIKEIFKELEAEVEQNVANSKHDEIEQKNLLIANDNLISDCLSKEVFYIAMNSELTVARFTKRHVAHTVVQVRCLELEAELSKLLDKVQKDDHTELVKWFSNLEVNHLNLQLKYQNLKESFRNNTSPPARDAPDFDSVFVIEKMKASIQGKDNAIKKLRMQISQLKETRSEADRTLDFRALDFQITQLTEKVNVLQEQNELFRAENEKVKQHYKELYDSIKITRAKHIEQTTALLTDNENLKAQIHENLKCITMDSVKPRVLAPGRYAIDVEPIPPRNRNNREVHLDYLKHLKESVETLREIVEEAKVERPLDSSLASACLYTKHSQELLEYVIGTCLKDFNTRYKQHASTPLTRKKQVTFEDQCETSNSNTHKRVEQLYIQKTNVPVPPSTGVNSCTGASGSQPRSNTKKNRILPAKSVNTKQVEEHLRTNKSSLKTMNRVD